jgi:hypothetical protein
MKPLKFILLISLFYSCASPVIKSDSVSTTEIKTQIEEIKKEGFIFTPENKIKMIMVLNRANESLKEKGSIIAQLEKSNKPQYNKFKLIGICLVLGCFFTFLFKIIIKIWVR